MSSSAIVIFHEVLTRPTAVFTKQSGNIYKKVPDVGLMVLWNSCFDTN